MTKKIVKTHFQITMVGSKGKVSIEGGLKDLVEAFYKASLGDPMVAALAHLTSAALMEANGKPKAAEKLVETMVDKQFLVASE